MRRVGESASKIRPSWLSRWLDAHRHARLGVVLGGLAIAVGLALVSGAAWEDRVFVVNTNLYLAVAGLFIVALAIERVTELIVAPWVGAGDHRITRNVMVGTFALVVGVVASGLLGLRLLSLLADGEPTTDFLAVSLDVLATGLAIGAGTKPLHDLITRLEDRTKAAKEAEEAADRPPIAGTPGAAVDGDMTAVVPSGGSYRIAVAAGRSTSTRAKRTLVDEVKRLLPDWTVGAAPRPPADAGESAPADSVLAYRSTPSVPGSPAFVNEQFAAAYRLHGVGLDVTVSPAAIASEATRTPQRPPRHSLVQLGVSPTTQHQGRGGKDVRIAVLDTGLRHHADGVPWKPGSPGADVLNPDGTGEDPLHETADWRDLDLMGSAGHGTGVAAVIAAPGTTDHTIYTPEWFDSSRMLGVAPEATIFPIRVMRGPVHLLDDDVAKGVRRAIKEKCHVISMSLGGLGFRGLEAAIAEAVENNIIVICAAGNQFGVVVEPASYPTTIAVASVDVDGAPFFDGSSRGPEVSISAPGVDVIRPDFVIEDGKEPTPVLTPGAGTTYATAHVAGVAALWLARHGRDALLAAYSDKPGRLPRLFAHVLATTATAWPEPHLATDWGPGRVNAQAVLNEPVMVQGDATVPGATLDAVFEHKAAAVAVTDRFAGGVAAFLRDDGAGEARADALWRMLSVWNRLKDRAGGVPATPVAVAVPAKPGERATKRETAQTVNEQRRDTRFPADERAATLLAAELRAHTGANPRFRRALLSSTGVRPVPAAATPELELVMTETNRVVTAQAARESGTSLPVDWGVGLSRPLRQALHGQGSMRRGFRSVGVIALVLAIALVVLLADTSAEVREIVSETGPGIALLGLGLYGSALAIERLLEFTVGRWAFKDVPGREMDRALILLGFGVLVGAVASMVLDLGLLEQVAASHTDDSTFRKADVVVTALAIGGGAKPIHDLLERIKVRKIS